ncbi:lysozyme inhibitor LprI family protein [Flexibacterium corallicola]|uniref:lysozyme inhibitor LprI family protein n=1 Tax=Flexibacterium corallicola TaxID=3037259 RepID=UPI00286F4AE0|nr:lysozyme inhibitor LprI family protein [Pseudovibrio sp. M1P-2-3]
MFVRTLLFLLVVCLSFAARGQSSSHLNTPTPKDREVFNSCLEKAGVKLAPAVACIGAVFEACQAEPKQQTSLGMRVCLSRESELWDERLNAAYEKLMAAYPDAAKKQLRKAERTWITYRKQDCDVPVVLYNKGSFGPVAAMHCFNRATALRAILLEQMITPS